MIRKLFTCGATYICLTMIICTVLLLGLLPEKIDNQLDYDKRLSNIEATLIKANANLALIELHSSPEYPIKTRFC